MDNKEKHYHEAVTLFGKGNLKDSLVSYQKALEIDPRYADALQGAAAVYERMGDLDQAVAHGLKVIQVEPGYLLAYTSLSIAFQKLGMIHSAEQMGNVARVLSWKEEAEQKKDAEDNSPFNIL